MNKILCAAAAVALAFGAVSCSKDNDPDTIYQHVIPDCYAVVTDLQSASQPTVSSSMTMRMLVNWTTMKADVTLSGLQIGGANYPTLAIDGASWNLTSDDWRHISASQTVATLASGASMTVSNFKVDWFDRLDFIPIAGAYDPGLSFSMLLDGRYSIRGSRNPFILTGTTETLKEGETTPYVTDQSIYVTKLDFNTGLATIGITNCCFAAGMPVFDNMTYEGIHFAIADNGTITLSADALIPSLAGTPQPRFPISDLSGTIVPAEGMTLDYTCTVMGTPYRAKVRLDYKSYTQQLD